jgi:shikimate dehydrogenase
MAEKKSKNAIRNAGEDKSISALLRQHRQRIDHIDQQVLDLLDQRLEVAKDIGKIKDLKNTNVIDTRREAAIFQKLLKLNQGRHLPPGSLFNIFTAIIAACREVQSSSERKTSRQPLPALFTVIGNPVSHSLSPVMHNTAFASIGFNGIYFALEMDDIRSAINGLKLLNFKGASITIPHKTSVIDLLDELDETAARINAVNTIVHHNGRLIGYNTDCTGALRALSEKIDIKARDVAIVGAGGAARAIGFGIKSHGGHVIILNRSKPNGERLSNELDAKFRPLSEVKELDCDILINTTPVGMSPRVNEICLPGNVLNKNMVVMDIVYTPLKTKLLQEAEKIGCTCIDGLSMFVYQGAQQLSLWTGRQAPVDIMRLAVLTALGN